MCEHIHFQYVKQRQKKCTVFYPTCDLGQLDAGGVELSVWPLVKNK